jgi:Mrp family chromosome partitioning ATPase
VRSSPVADAAAVKLGRPGTARELLSHVSTKVVGATEIFDIAFTAGTAAGARNGANAFADAYLAQRRADADRKAQAVVANLQRQAQDLNDQLQQLSAAAPLPSAGSVARLDSQVTSDALALQLVQLRSKIAALRALDLDAGAVLQPATEGSASKSLSAVGSVGGVALGLLAGLVLAFARDRADRRVRTADHVELELVAPVLGIIPSGGWLHRSHRLELPSRSSPAFDAYRRLQVSLAVATEERKGTTLLVTSPRPDQEKSLTAVNVAVGAARSGQRVLLIAADRRSVVPEVLGLSASQSVTGFVAGGVDASAVVQRPDGMANLAVVVLGGGDQTVGELLHTDAVRSILATDREAADLVVVDGPPTLSDADALELVRTADHVLVVATAGRTTREDLARARWELGRVGAPVLGGVVARSRDDATVPRATLRQPAPRAPQSARRTADANGNGRRGPDIAATTDLGLSTFDAPASDLPVVTGDGRTDPPLGTNVLGWAFGRVGRRAGARPDRRWD